MKLSLKQNTLSSKKSDYIQSFQESKESPNRRLFALREALEGYERKSTEKTAHFGVTQSNSESSGGAVKNFSNGSPTIKDSNGSLLTSFRINFNQCIEKEEEGPAKLISFSHSSPKCLSKSRLSPMSGKNVERGRKSTFAVYAEECNRKEQEEKTSGAEDKRESSASATPVAKRYDGEEVKEKLRTTVQTKETQARYKEVMCKNILKQHHVKSVSHKNLPSPKKA
jgi:hypothetical protein